jgi:hypothetical protein
MIDQDTIKEVFAIAEQRRAERRRFIKMAGAAAVATGALSTLAACGDNDDSYESPIAVTPTPTPAPVATTDVDVLNFALNLEYLEANYYSFSALGAGLNDALRSGSGNQGAVTGGRKVNFADATVASYAREIAADENAHVTFLRTQLGSSAVAMPAINIDGGASGAFTAAARAAGIVDATGTFDPYLNDDTWLLGGMLLSDVGVTAYKGSATLIANKTFLEAAAGILAVEAYHSGLIRTLLYSRGIAPAAPIATATNNRTYSNMISDARDAVDGTAASLNAAGPPQTYADDDQGVTQAPGNATTSNIVPTDTNGIVFGRTAANVLNVVYLNKAQTTSGGFFPNGVNGSIRTSNNNA